MEWPKAETMGLFGYFAGFSKYESGGDFDGSCSPSSLSGEPSPGRLVARDMVTLSSRIPNLLPPQVRRKCRVKTSVENQIVENRIVKMVT